MGDLSRGSGVGIFFENAAHTDPLQAPLNVAPLIIRDRAWPGKSDLDLLKTMAVDGVPEKEEEFWLFGYG